MHNHLGEEFGKGWEKRPIAELLDLMDTAGVKIFVDLDGGWSETILNHRLEKYKFAAPERFSCFGCVDWSAWSEHSENFGEWAARRLQLQAQRGAEGLKIWKNFGLSVRDHKGEVVKVDDVRLGPLWQTAAELGLPVMIHVADPVAFFDPLDEYNERWEELFTHPDWHFLSPPYPPFLEIIHGLANLVERHPLTTFIGAHVGCYAENLGWVSGLLSRCPNFYVDIAARISELGRQPASARQFFSDHSDRILFGLDLGPDLESYRLYYRFLETSDEYFNYSTEESPPQGRWNIYGLSLPEDILRKVYYENAGRILKLPLEKLR
jgi:predicted TIM-barrel fold metal-dependent hydrolase